MRHKRLLMLHTWGVSSFLCYQNCWTTAMLTKVELCVLNVFGCVSNDTAKMSYVFSTCFDVFERSGKLEHTFSAYISFCVEGLETLSAL